MPWIIIIREEKERNCGRRGRVGSCVLDMVIDGLRRPEEKRRGCGLFGEQKGMDAVVVVQKMKDKKLEGVEIGKETDRMVVRV